VNHIYPVLWLLCACIDVFIVHMINSLVHRCMIDNMYDFSVE
jgi:hypothetical protein